MNDPRRPSLALTRIVAFGAAAVFLLVFLPRISAQEEYWDFQEDSQTFTSQVQVSRSRTAEQDIERAKNDIAAKEYERAVRLIQGVLDQKSPGMFTDPTTGTTSIREFCCRFLRDLPPEAMARYRAIFDPYAKEVFEAARRTKDVSALLDAFARYRMTSHGPAILAFAVQVLFERGDVHDAGALAMLYTEAFTGDERVPSMRAIIAMSLAAREKTKRLEDYLRGLDPAAAAAETEIAGKKIAISEFIARLAQSAKPADAAEPPASDAPVFTTPQWSRVLEMSEREPRTQGQFKDINGQTVSEMAFSWHPAVPVTDDSTVYVSTGVAVYAFNLYSGDEKWKKPVTGWADQLQARRNLGVIFPIAADRGVVFAALETPQEEERVIWSFTPHMVVPRRKLVAIDAASGAVLWSHFDAQGKTAAETEFLQGLNISSAPLVIGDSIICSATRYHTSFHHYLVAFDRRTGALTWSVFVCTGQMEQNMFGNPVREAIAGDILESDGIVYYSTNIGVVAAVDIRQGTLLFTTPYRQLEIPRQTRYDTTIQERAPGFMNGRPVLFQKTLFVAPMDSADLLAIDTTTGLAKSVVSRTTANRLRYLIGEHDGRILLAGRQILAFDAVTFEKRYELTLSTSTNPAEGLQGRPVIVGDRLFGTVRAAGRDQFSVWDLKKTKLESQAPLPRVDFQNFCGNMTARGNAIIVASASLSMNRPSQIQVRCYVDKAAVRARLEAAAGPDATPRALVDFGEYLLQEREFAAAKAMLERALDLATRAGDGEDKSFGAAREALYRLNLALAQSPATAGGDAGVFAAYESAMHYAGLRSQRLDILFRLVQKAANAKAWDRFDRYLTEIAERYSEDPYDYDDLFVKDAPMLATLRHYERAGPIAAYLKAAYLALRGNVIESVDAYQAMLLAYRRESLGRELAGQVAYQAIDAAIAANGRAVYQKHDADADALFLAADAAGDLAQLQKILEIYPNSARVGDSQKSLARRFVEKKRFADAARALSDCILKKSGTPIEEVALLAEVYDAAGLLESARAAWRYVATGRPSTDSAALTETIEAAKKKAGDLAPRAWAESNKAEALALDIKEKWRLGKSGPPAEWTIVNPAGERPAAMQDRILVHHGTEVLCLALADGKTLWKASASRPPDTDQCAFVDGRFVALLDLEAAAIDPSSGQELWRASFAERRPRALRGAHGKVYVLALTGPISFELEAVSAIDGRSVYRRAFDGAPYDRIDVADQWVMIPYQSSETRAAVIDAFTGRPVGPNPGGIAGDSKVLPFLAADGQVVHAARNARTRRMSLESIDPQTGIEKWSREFDDEALRDFYADKSTIVIVTNTRHPQRPGKTRDQVTILDAVRGVVLFTRTFDGDAQVRPRGTTFTGEEVYIPLRQTSTEHGMTVKIFVECSSIATQTAVWQTAALTGAKTIGVKAFDRGITLSVTERKFAPGRITTQTSIFLVDKKTARVVWEQALDTDAPISEDAMAITGGRLVVADGTILKVFGP